MNPKKLIPCFLVFGLVSVAAAQNANQNYLTDPQLMQMAGDQYASGELPLGDQHYVLDAPRKGYIYLCRKYGDGAGGAQHAGNWIHGDTWNWRKKIFTSTG